MFCDTTLLMSVELCKITIMTIIFIIVTILPQIWYAAKCLDVGPVLNCLSKSLIAPSEDMSGLLFIVDL